MKSASAKYLFWSLILLAIFLRFFDLNNYPQPLFTDELTTLYDAHSINETGADRWGNRLPFVLRGCGEGDYRPALYTWLVTVPVKVFGPTAFAVRLPSVILSILSLLLLYYVVWKLHSTRAALIALLIGVLSPWHLLYSRLGLEATMLPGFFMISILAMWIKVREKSFGHFYMLLLGLVIGLSTNSYHPFKLISLLLVLVVAIDVLVFGKQKIKSLILLCIGAVLGAFPQIWTLFSEPDQFFARAQNTVTEVQTFKGQVYYFFMNFAENLQPDFLFFGFGKYNGFSIGRLLAVEVVFFYLGWLVIFRQYGKNQKWFPIYIIACALIAIIPSALTPDNPNAIRISGLICLAPILSSAGITYLHDKITGSISKKIMIISCVLLILANGFYNIVTYVYTPEYSNVKQQYFRVLLADKIKEMESDYNSVIMQRVGTQMYLNVIWSCEMPPDEFRSARKKITQTSSGWDRFEQLDKFYFIDGEDVDNLNFADYGKFLVITGKKQPHLFLLDSLSYGPDKMYFHSEM